jgi:hypothetical protein
MKCKVCARHAVVDIRRHNAAFCGDHFVEHIRSQVARTIKEFKMFRPDDRLLVAVSGGKDSLALWDILLDLGYDVTGFYLDLGIGGYSARSKDAAIAYAEGRAAKLLVRSLAEEHGYTVPELARLTARVPCSGCGLNKRYEFNPRRSRTASRCWSRATISTTRSRRCSGTYCTGMWTCLAAKPQCSKKGSSGMARRRAPRWCARSSPW